VPSLSTPKSKERRLYLKTKNDRLSEKCNILSKKESNLTKYGLQNFTN
jgi:hypothetical protein